MGEAVLVPVGTVMVTMRSINASCLRIKLALRPTRRSGRKTRRRNLGLEVLLQVVSNMRDQGLVVVEIHKSPLEAALKNSTMSGTCFAARVVDGTVPTLQGSTLLLLPIHLPFPQHCLQPIPIIKRLQKNSVKQVLSHLLLLQLLQLQLPLVPPTVARSPLTKASFWLYVSIMSAP